MQLKEVSSISCEVNLPLVPGRQFYPLPRLSGLCKKGLNPPFQFPLTNLHHLLIFCHWYFFLIKWYIILLFRSFMILILYKTSVLGCAWNFLLLFHNQLPVISHSNHQSSSTSSTFFLFSHLFHQSNRLPLVDWHWRPRWKLEQLGRASWQYTFFVPTRCYINVFTHTCIQEAAPKNILQSAVVLEGHSTVFHD